MMFKIIRSNLKFHSVYLRGGDIDMHFSVRFRSYSMELNKHVFSSLCDLMLYPSLQHVPSFYKIFFPEYQLPQ